MRIKKQITSIQCYFLLISLFMLFYWVTCFIKNGEPLLYMFATGSTSDTYMDFFHSMDNARTGNPYLKFSNYPALALLFYRVLYRFVPIELRGENGVDLRNNEMAQIMLIVYTMLCLFSILHMIYQRVKLQNWEKAWFSVIILLSTPIIFVLERGNLVLFSFVLTMFFCYYHDSKSKLLKELAFIALAISAALKLYPAVFGLILVKKRKYKETFRLVIYGVLSFFLPFLLYGGLSALKIMIQALRYTSDANWGYGIDWSVKNLVALSGRLFGIPLNQNVELIATGIIAIILIISFFVAKNTTLEWTALTLLVMMIPPMSYLYSAVFLLLPLTEGINLLSIQEKYKPDTQKTLIDFSQINHKIFLAACAIILIPWPFDWIEMLQEDKFPTSIGRILQYGAEIVLLALCIKIILSTLIRHFKKQRM